MQQNAKMADSSGEEGAHLDSPARAQPLPNDTSKSEVSEGNAPTPDELFALMRRFAESCSLALVPMDPIRDQFWASILSCMKLPCGGMNGGGSMRCSFEFVAASESIVKHVMEDLPLMPNMRYRSDTL